MRLVAQGELTGSQRPMVTPETGVADDHARHDLPAPHHGEGSATTGQWRTQRDMPSAKEQEKPAGHELGVPAVQGVPSAVEGVAARQPQKRNALVVPGALRSIQSQASPGAQPSPVIGLQPSAQNPSIVRCA